jgi:hypothetical protein
VLRYLPALRSLDLGFDSSHFIMDWDTIPVRAPLTYLRVTLDCVSDLLAIMMTRPLSTTLRQLHVKIRDSGLILGFQVSEMQIAFSMSSLHTFTFIKSLYRQFVDEWKLIDALTSSNVMPVLQQAKVIVAIEASDLNPIGRSGLFNDHRLVDVQYAFIIADDRSHADFNKQITRGSRSHPRFVASATFVRGTSTDNRSYGKYGQRFVSFILSFDQSNDPIRSYRAGISKLDIICGIDVF